MRELVFALEFRGTAGAGAVTGGRGTFTDATELITSNFTVSAQGEVVDHHVARLCLA